jgi:hypothetical protein
MSTSLVITTLLLMTGTPDAASEAKTPVPAAAPVPPAPQKLRAPIEAGGVRESDLLLDRYFREIVVERKRTEGKTFATFTAEPKLLDAGSVMVFEASSVASSGVVPRWRCVATYDVAECLGAPVKIAYLPADEAIRLTARLLPRAQLGKDKAVASR